MIDEAVLADAKRETLINGGSLVLRLNAFDIFPTARIHRIIHVLIRAFIRLLLDQHSGTEDAVGVPVFRIEIKRFWIRY